MDRRSLLRLSAVATTVGIAGCEGLLDDAGETESEDDATATPEQETQSSSSSLPAWSDWIPSAVLPDGGETQVTAVSVPALRSKYPDSLADRFSLGSLRDTLGLEPGDLGTVTAVRPPDPGSTLIVHGDFAASNVLDELDTAGAETTSAGEFTIVDESYAVADETVIISSSYQQFVDTKTGDTEAFPDGDAEWQDLDGYVGEWDLYYVWNGPYPAARGIDMRKSTMTIHTTTDGTISYQLHHAFDSDDTAERMAEEDSALRQIDAPHEELTVEDVTTSGRYLVIFYEHESVDEVFDDSVSTS